MKRRQQCGWRGHSVDLGKWSFMMQVSRQWPVLGWHCRRTMVRTWIVLLIGDPSFFVHSPNCPQLRVNVELAIRLSEVALSLFNVLPYFPESLLVLAKAIWQAGAFCESEDCCNDSVYCSECCNLCMRAVSSSQGGQCRGKDDLTQQAHIDEEGAHQVLSSCRVLLVVNPLVLKKSRVSILRHESVSRLRDVCHEPTALSCPDKA
jgi:hypothetical protein